MKNYLLTILTVLLFINSSLSAQDGIPHYSHTIIASKNGIEKIYKLGSRLFITYQNGSDQQKLRGYFTGVTNGKIAIARKKKTSEEILIPVENITVLRKINPGKRIIYGAVGTALVAGGAAIINKRSNSPGAGMRDALIIPIIGVGVYSLCVVPATLLLEKLSEKKRSSGWTFHAR
ncbi:MAG: hypothetical protein JWN76_3390 [Chitinophagaceae bacterium]|nr:hypothetical protein [Chitinophagaceae bacterium]